MFYFSVELNILRLSISGLDYFFNLNCFVIVILFFSFNYLTKGVAIFFVMAKCSIEVFLKFTNLFFCVIEFTKPRESQGFACSCFSLREVF